MVENNENKVKIERCAELADELERIGSDLLGRLLDGKLPVPDAEDIECYNAKFDDLQSELDSLPILGGAEAGLGGSAKAAVGEALPELIDTLKKLVGSHEALIKAVSENTEYQKERLQAIGKAKDIFKKFVKRQPEGSESRFYDKIG